MKLAVVWLLALTLLGQAQAQGAAPPVSTGLQASSGQPSVEQWLMRLHEATGQSAYVGTFVVTAGNYMSSARIWHVCEGTQQIERVEALTGAPRATFRRNDQVVTFFPERRVVVVEQRTSLGLFPSLLHRADSSIAQFYRLKIGGRDRVAGRVANVVQLEPRDPWRFGYRVWTEQASGLVMKLQTLDASQQVLEQAAFSDFQLAQPLSWAKLSAMMDSTDGYVVKRPELISTRADQEGWQLNVDVPGFKSMGCHRSQAHAAPVGAGTFQWVFSDGLASVSVFIEAFDGARHSKPQRHESLGMGATHVVTRQLASWWVTVVGEVPVPTLQRFAQAVERIKSAKGD